MFKGNLTNATSVAVDPGSVRSGMMTSGSVGWAHLASGAVIAGSLGSGAVRSGNVGSGQIDTNHHASGSTSPRSQFTSPLAGGTNWSVTAEEPISGGRLVHLSQSGLLRIAMAGLSGRMPAVGLVVDAVASGAAADVYTGGLFQLSSGMADFSGWLGRRAWVGRSGQPVSLSGSWGSGGHLSGDLGQPVGVIANSGAVYLLLTPVAWSGGPLGVATGGNLGLL